jgi:hypothetical protein
MYYTNIIFSFSGFLVWFAAHRACKVTLPPARCKIEVSLMVTKMTNYPIVINVLYKHYFPICGLFVLVYSPPGL